MGIFDVFKRTEQIKYPRGIDDFAIGLVNGNGNDLIGMKDGNVAKSSDDVSTFDYWLECKYDRSGKWYYPCQKYSLDSIKKVVKDIDFFKLEEPKEFHDFKITHEACLSLITVLTEDNELKLISIVPGSGESVVVRYIQTDDDQNPLTYIAKKTAYNFCSYYEELESCEYKDETDYSFWDFMPSTGSREFDIED